MGSDNEIDLSGSKVLVVEDNHACFLLIQEYLEILGADYVQALSIQEVEAYLTDKDIKYAVVDNVLSYGINGMDITKRIKDIRQDITVVMQTAYATPAEIGKCFMAGCDDLIIKPYSFEQFQNALLLKSPA